MIRADDVPGSVQFSALSLWEFLAVRCGVMRPEFRGILGRSTTGSDPVLV